MGLERLFRCITDVEMDIETEFEAINTIGGKSWCTDGDLYAYQGYLLPQKPYESTCLYIINALARNYYDFVDADMTLFIRDDDAW